MRAGVTMTPMGGSFKTRIVAGCRSSSSSSLELRRRGLGGAATMQAPPSESNLMANDLTSAEPMETDFLGESDSFLGEPRKLEPPDETLSPSVLTVRLV